MKLSMKTQNKSENKKIDSKLPFEITNMKFLLGSEKPDAKKMIKRLESNDLEDCIEQTWKWLALNSPLPSDQNDQRRNEKFVTKLANY